MGGLIKSPRDLLDVHGRALGLCGVPPSAAFYSKDSIIAQTPGQHNTCFLRRPCLSGAVHFYMSVCSNVAFWDAAHCVKRNMPTNPRIMVWPLRLLAVMSVIGGVIGISEIYARHFSGGEAKALPVFTTH